ncbi:hypothetical protein D9M71_627820 [compost metagenome]
MLNRGAFVIVPSCHILWGVAHNCLDNGFIQRHAVALRVTQVSDQRMSERVDALSVVWFMNTNGDKISPGLLIEELTGTLRPAFLVVGRVIGSRWQVGEAVAEQLLLIGSPLDVHILKETQLNQARMNRHKPGFVGLDPLCFRCLRIISAEVEARMPINFLDVGCIELRNLVRASASEIADQG